MHDPATCRNGDHYGQCSGVTLPYFARQMGQVTPDHPDARKPVGWGEHPRDCDCGDCP